MVDMIPTRDINAMSAPERREYIISLITYKEYAEKAYRDAIREVVSLRAELAGLREIEATRDKRRDAAIKLLAQLGITDPCESFHIENGVTVCWGTKNCEVCGCGGDRALCTHYKPSEVHNEAEH